MKRIFFALVFFILLQVQTQAACTYTYTIAVAHTACGLNNGVVSISNVAGGTAPYTFVLDNQQTNNTGSFSGVAAGSHIVSISDVNNCVFYLPTVIVNNSTAITNAVVYSLATSCGSNNGAITISTITGGQAPYTYKLNNQPFVTSNVFTNLSAGNYQVQVKDNLGCIYQAPSISIAQSYGMQGVATTSISTACDSSHGEVHINGMIGGTPPFQYNFNNQGFSSTVDFYNLAVGSYTLQVTDSSNCLFNAATVGVNSIDGIQMAYVSHENASCNQQNGKIVIDSIQGGHAPYTYNLNNSSYVNNNSFVQLPAGVYTLQIKDSAGCSFQAPNVFIANNVIGSGVPSISIEAESSLICSNASTRIKIKSMQNQGVTPSYQWYMVVFGNTQIITGANADELLVPPVFNGFSVNGVQFYVKMYSSDDCVVNSEAVSNYVNINVLNNTVSQTTDFSANNTQLTQAPYEVTFTNTSFYQLNRRYVWGFGDGSIYEGVTPPKHVYALPGNYSVSMMVKDLSSGCTDTLFREAYIHINGTSTSCNTNINVFPSDSVTLCYLEKKWLSVSSDAANPTYQWYRNGMLLGGETNDSLLVDEAGAYSVVVYSNQACPVSSPIIHVRMSYVPSTIPEVASSGSIGDCSSPTNLTLNATNGFTNYQWNNGANTQSVTVHEAGLYQVSAQDVFGCVLKSNVIRLNTANIPATDLCMASFDSLANRNRVAWTKNPAWLAATDSFFVYECEKDNSYRLIKKQSKTALGTVLSSSSNPYVRSYDYLLASSDTCGNKVFSEFRRNNIFLQVNAGMGVYRQLSWTAYHDTLPFYYKIYRYTIGSVLCIDSVPSTKLYYIDQTSNDINAQYKVAVFFDEACAIENGNTYAASFSNPAYNNVVAIPMQVSVQEHVGEKELWAYPNPTSNRVTIGCSTFVTGYVLTDLFGNTVMHENVSSTKTIEIDLQSLASGMYQLRVLGGTTKTLLLVKH